MKLLSFTKKLAGVAFHKAKEVAANYIIENSSAVSRTVNALTGGKAEQTLSARAGLNAEQGKIVWKFVALIIDLLVRWIDGKYHCQREADKTKAGTGQ